MENVGRLGGGLDKVEYGTQIREFYLRECYVHSEIKKSDGWCRVQDDYFKASPCSNFFEELRYAVSRVTNLIKIDCLEFSNKEFIQLVKTAKKAKILRFWSCKISFDSEFDSEFDLEFDLEFDFGPMEGCLIEEINIGNYDQVYDGWSEYKEYLMKIFRGILNCTNLIKSLKVLRFYCSKNLKQKMTEKARGKFGEEYLEIMPYLKYF